jgi:hypothetical protein
MFRLKTDFSKTSRCKELEKVNLKYLPKQKQLVSFSSDGMIKFWNIDPADLK